MEQNKNIEQPVTFTSSELEAQGYANPAAHPALADAEKPITFTAEELEAQGYTNPAAHPAVEKVEAGHASASSIEVRDEGTGETAITVTPGDIVGGVRLAAERRDYAVDGTTGTVLLPSEVARADRGTESVRR